MKNEQKNLKPAASSSGNEDLVQQMQDYKRKIETILESFTDAYFEVDKQWTVTYWNKEAENLLRMPRKDIIGKNLWDAYKDAVNLKFYTEYHRSVEHHIAVRFEEYFEPMQLWVEVSAFPSGEGLSVYFKDITQRKQATEQLEKERQKYNDLFNRSPLPQWVYDLDSLCFLDVNEAAIRHYGFSRAEFMNMTIKDIRPREDIKILERILDPAVLKERFNMSTVRHLKKSGEIIYVDVESNAVVFNDHNARLVMAIDQTKKIEAEKQTAESINRFNTVSKATSDVIWDRDMQTGQMIWNHGIQGVFGYDQNVYNLDWWQDKVHPDDLNNVLLQLNLLIQQKQSRLKMKYRFRCADGEYKSVLDRAFIQFDQQGKALRIIGSMQDITDQIKYIKEIEEQNTMLKDISWTQAHEFRAPLAKIMGLVSLLDEKGKSKPDSATINHIKSSAAELDQVIRSVLNKTIKPNK